MITGHFLVAGEWVDGAETFNSTPSGGAPRTYFQGTAADVDVAAKAAERAFETYGQTSRERRAAFLDRIADEIEARGEEITEIGCSETGLPPARLEGERGRTVGQLRLFASHILDGAYLDRRHDEALPDRAPLPRPELWMVQRPIGPVAVFGASNFPLAFSTAGGDTAAALAAGCPVIVKGHPAHPGTGEIVAQAVDAGIKALGLDPGVFSFIQDSGIAVGVALAQHPAIKAVGFTGSLRGGRALFDLCARRPEPIPFFGELGSVNPVFILPRAGAARAAEIAEAWAGSLVMGAGQFCTNPGVVVVEAGEKADAFVAAAKAALTEVSDQTMLTDGIAEAFRAGRARISGADNVEPVLEVASDGRTAAPHVYRVTAEGFLEDDGIGEEVFGPLGVVVTVSGIEQMIAIARSLHGQLTATMQMDAEDGDAARALLPILERKAGRVLANGFPTGVEVADAMVHGGPYPASTNFGATSVGTLSIRRFLRPVCYQNIPEDVLPLDLQRCG